jgi:hypothetical protein
MSAFLSKLCVELADNKDDGKWILTKTLFYQSDIAKQVFVIPRGFQTDFASVPRLPIIYWLTGNTATEAAVVHDWLYNTHTVSRAMADAVLREAAAVTGVPAWRRWMMWAGVRFGGEPYWDKPAIASAPLVVKEA